MKWQKTLKRSRIYFAIFIVVLILWLPVTIPLKLAIARYQSPEPQAIFTLGGGKKREIFTAQFAKSYLSLPIWVSTGQPRLKANRIFQKAGISLSRINLDYRAIDTVTNFTSLVKDFKQQNYQHIYLITSDFHMSRAKTIGFIVLGSHSIAYSPVTIPTTRKPEPKSKVIRDAARAVIWLITGKTGSRFKAKYG